MSSKPSRIILHPALAQLVRWDLVTDAHHDWHLLTDARSARRLTDSGQHHRFSSIRVLPPLTEQTRPEYFQAIEERLNDDTRLASMLEPMLAIVGVARDRFGLTGCIDPVDDPANDPDFGEYRSPGSSLLARWWDKRAMKTQLTGWDALIPWLQVEPTDFECPRESASVAIARLGLPIFAKPAARYSSAGAQVLRSQMEVEQFFSKPCSDYVLERFLEGTMYHVDSVQIRGKTAWVGAAKYFAPCFSALEGAPLGSLAVDRESEEFERLVAFHEDVMRRMAPVPDGTTHLELFNDTRNKLWFCEVAARCPGLMTPEMYLAHQGVDLRVSHYRASFGLADPVARIEGERHRHVAWWVPLKTKPGVVTELSLPSFQSRVQSWWQCSAMQVPEPVRSSGLADVLGKVLLCSDTEVALAHDIELLSHWEPCEFL